MQRRRRGFGADQVGGAGLGAGTAAGQKRKGCRPGKLCLGRLADLGNHLYTQAGTRQVPMYWLPCGPRAPGPMGEVRPSDWQAGRWQVAGGQVPA